MLHVGVFCRGLGGDGKRLYHYEVCVNDRCVQRGDVEHRPENGWAKLLETIVDDKVVVVMGEKCKWTQDDWHGAYDTDCGQCFSINAGTLVENGMRFCCYCGKELEEVVAVDDSL